LNTSILTIEHVLRIQDKEEFLTTQISFYMQEFRRYPRWEYGHFSASASSDKVDQPPVSLWNPQVWFEVSQIPVQAAFSQRKTEERCLLRKKIT